MIKIYLYTSVQEFDVCPLTGKTIAKNFGELVHNIEFNQEQEKLHPNDTFVVPTYVVPWSGSPRVDVIFPDGNVVNGITAEEVSKVILSGYKNASDAIDSNPNILKKHGITQKIASSFIKWRDGLYIEEHVEELEEAMKKAVKEAREEAADKINDLDILAMVMKKYSISGDDVEQIYYNEKLIEPEEYQDFYHTIMNIIVSKNDESVLKSEIHASNLEKYDYTVMCKDGWIIEANATVTTIKHDGIVQMTIEKNQEW